MTAMSDSVIHTPAPIGRASRAVIRSLLVTIGLLIRHRIRLPRNNVGLRIGFANGTGARVFRETVIIDSVPRDPCVLLVEFELRAVRGRGHALFRRESLLNTLLFAGFPGLVSKLWLTDDEHGAYRGLYEWDGPASAEAYARALWRVLALVSVRGSIDYHVLPGLRRVDLFESAHRTDGHGEWWRPTEIGTTLNRGVS
ncbi:hypothetical protein DFR76_102673 [Nocardia pseudobrasiliensis]|uniref:Uncharacterized protein n=2 Tax=Nocardia pseudobrasiliensis TaxID=45979 RepID=A0A370IC10_9NOCA|nr:hypothetical protein DFR76_102673 [Nocardia pseudobrasiliensis]